MFPKAAVLLHFLQQCMKVLNSPHPCQHFQRCLFYYSHPSEGEVVAFIGIFLVASDGYAFVCLLASVCLLETYVIQTLCPL